jgi:membrane protein YdbS with pleckstrin-like domain
MMPSDPTPSDQIVSDPIDSDTTPFESPTIDKVQSVPGPVAAGHLHPLALGFDLFRLVRGFLLPAIPLLLFSRRSSWGVMLMLLAVFALGRAVVRYVSFTYRVEGGELITREGLIGRTERHIRFERIQEVRIEQSLMHRIFGVVEAKVETGSGGGPEATFTVMARREAEALKAAVQSGSARSVSGLPLDASTDLPPAAADRSVSEREVLWRLSVRDLFSSSSARCGRCLTTCCRKTFIKGSMKRFDSLPVARRARACARRLSSP